MSTYSESAFPVPDDVGFELEDDLPRGPRPLALSRRVTFAIALVLAVALAAGAAAMAYNVGKATQSEPAAKVDVEQQVAAANAAGVAAGTKAGYDNGFAAGLEKGTNASSEKAFNRGFARGKKRGIAEGLRDGRRRGFSDGADSVSGKYQAAIATLTAQLEQANKDLAAAEKAADKANKAAQAPAGAP
jgi:flagellar biosynthesis/type III secretory pathway protein FliH